MCSQLHNHLYSVSQAYGLWCHPHLDNHMDMHCSDNGKTQLSSLQYDGVQGEEEEMRGGEAQIMHHVDESAACHDINNLFSESFSEKSDIV